MSEEIDKAEVDFTLLKERIAQLEAFVPVRGRMFEAVKEMYRALGVFEASLLGDHRSTNDKRMVRLAKAILEDCDPKYAMYRPGRKLARLVLGQDDDLEKGGEL